nr:DUF262 domain-containing protein [Loktanella sp. F6476L]
MAENEDDISVSAIQFSNLIVAPADWTVGTIFSQIGKQIDLDPEFQRRDVWSPSSKTKFIESLFLGIPIPQILLSVKADKKGSYIVLDGKQRLLTIWEFLSGEMLDGKPFKLKGLRILKELEGLTWAEIKLLPDWEDQLLNETVRTTIVKNWDSQEVLYEIFYRLNSGSVQLSPMELRMALYPGQFLKWVVNWTETIGPLHQLLRKRRADKRMADVELVVRHLSFSLSPREYNGDLKKYLDEFCDYANTNFENLEATLKNEVARMDLAISLGMEIFPDNTFCRKYIHFEYESRFNRALFDVLVGSLSDVEFYHYANGHRVEVKQSFENLCDNNKDFIRSVETSTKNVEPTLTRYRAWYDEVRELSGIEIELPSIRK